MNKKFVQSAFLVFITSVIVIVLAHTFVDGFGFHLNYTISRYVGLTQWSATAFLICNVVVGILLFQYLKQIRDAWGMPKRWWYASTLMLLMLVVLSIFPVGLYDEVWGEFGMVSTIHRVSSATMFLLAIVTGLETTIKFRKSRFVKDFGAFFVVYGVAVATLFAADSPVFWNAALIEETMFLVLYLILIMGIPKFEVGNKKLDD